MVSCKYWRFCSEMKLPLSSYFLALIDMNVNAHGGIEFGFENKCFCLTAVNCMGRVVCGFC